MGDSYVRSLDHRICQILLSVIFSMVLNECMLVNRVYFLVQNRLKSKFSDLSVLQKDLLMQDWVFRLGVCPILGEKRAYIALHFGMYNNM